MKHGANPDLRDEDGKTPLDKARERQDEGHREVAAMLQSPGEWMAPGEKDKKLEPVECEELGEPRGDAEMAPVYLTRMLPVFCHTFQSTMLPSVRCALKIHSIPKLLYLLLQENESGFNQENGSLYSAQFACGNMWPRGSVTQSGSHAR